MKPFAQDEYLTLMDKLAGSVERITLYNPENDYTVLCLRLEVR